MWGEVWKVCCGVGEVRRDVGKGVGVWRSVGGGVGKCVGVWGVRGDVRRGVESVEGVVGKCVGVRGVKGDVGRGTCGVWKSVGGGVKCWGEV